MVINHQLIYLSFTSFPFEALQKVYRTSGHGFATAKVMALEDMATADSFYLTRSKETFGFIGYSPHNFF